MDCNDNVSLFSIRLVVLKLYDGKYDTVENVHFEKRLFPILYSYSCLLIAQEIITSFSTNTYKVHGPNFARRCVVEGTYYL